MKIIDALNQAPQEDGLPVLADEGHGIVRLWTLVGPFSDGRTMRALRRFFPAAEIKNRELLRLGGFRSLAEAQSTVAEAKMTSSSPAVQSLVRYDVPESLATIKHFS